MRRLRTRTPNENQAKDCAEERLSPKREGGAMRVEAGLGSPLQTRLCSKGTVQQDVASTDVCMKTAKASVETAR
jgi:hypothetical protein